MKDGDPAAAECVSVWISTAPKVKGGHAHIWQKEDIKTKGLAYRAQKF